MIINSFLQLEFSWEGFAKIGVYFLISLAAQLLFFLIIFLVLRKKLSDSKYRILSVGSVLGNVGYLGMPVISSIFPNEPIVLCYNSINVMTMNLIVFTVGTYMITNDRKYISLKSAILYDYSWNETCTIFNKVAFYQRIRLCHLPAQLLNLLQNFTTASRILQPM